MKDEFIKLKGENKGSISVIIAGVHGNEKCGVNALEELLPSLKIKRGVVFVGYGNPLAIENNARYVETNLNRMFRSKKDISKQEKGSYEYKRAQLIKKYLNKASALLDIHASFTPRSKPFVICENNAMDIVSHLPFNLIVSGFDKIQPGGTDFYMNSMRKIGICIECGYLKNKKSTQVAKKSILAFLISQGHIDGISKKQKQSSIKIYKQYITKTSNFTLSKKFKDFENLSKNQIIGLDGNKKIKAPTESIILFARNSEKTGNEAFLLGKYKRV